MTDDALDPRLRLSNADRENAFLVLERAAAQGRLEPSEFAQRAEAAQAAKTYGDLDAVLRDLPVAVGEVVSVPEDTMDVDPVSTHVAYDGDWRVPGRIAVRPRSSSVSLDFTDAVIRHRVVEVDLDVSSSSVGITLPHDAWASVDVERFGSSIANRAGRRDDTRGVEFRVRGEIRMSSLSITRRRRLRGG